MSSRQYLNQSNKVRDLCDETRRLGTMKQNQTELQSFNTIELNPFYAVGLILCSVIVKTDQGRS